MTPAEIAAIRERDAHWRPEFMRAASESLERLIRAVNPPWLASPLPAVPAGFMQVLDGTGGRTWDRTTDPYHVKEAVPAIIQVLRVANDD